MSLAGRSGLARIRGSLQGSSFVRQVLAVSGSSFFSLALSLAVGPINSRLYRPLDYGTLALFGAIFTLAGVVGALQYEMAIPVAEDEDEGAHLLLLSLLLVLFWTVVAVLTVAWAGPALARFIAKDDPQIARFLWFLPPGVFLAAMYQVLNRWAIRQQKFQAFSAANILGSSLGSACTIGMGLSGMGFKGLIVGEVLSKSSMDGVLAWAGYRRFMDRFRNLSWQGLKHAAARYYRFPLYNSWAVLLTNLSNIAPVFLLTKGFGASYTGYFSLCNRVLFLPTLLISGAITPVFYSRAKKAQVEGNLRALTLNILNGIGALNISFTVFVAVFGELLFVWAFGPQWRRAGQYAAGLAPWILCAFLVNPLEGLPMLFDRQRTVFGFQLVLFGVRSGSILAGIALKHDLAAIWMFGTTSALYTLVYLAWLLKLVDAPIKPLARRMGRELLLSGALFGACRLFAAWVGNRPLPTLLVLAPVLGFFAVRGVRQLLQARETTAQEA
jgi:O-antigen/teichoic acid export membrane protein